MTSALRGASTTCCRSTPQWQTDGSCCRKHGVTERRLVERTLNTRTCRLSEKRFCGITTNRDCQDAPPARTVCQRNRRSVCRLRATRASASQMVGPCHSLAAANIARDTTLPVRHVPALQQRLPIVLLLLFPSEQSLVRSWPCREARRLFSRYSDRRPLPRPSVDTRETPS